MAGSICAVPAATTSTTFPLSAPYPPGSWVMFSRVRVLPVRLAGYALLAMAVFAMPFSEMLRAEQLPTIERGISAGSRDSAVNVSKRVALVVGNATYQHAEPLANPINDGKALAAVLRRMGFVVLQAMDQDLEGMRENLRSFQMEL
ncbi:MAG: caspase family protein, partial [Pseudomonadota bacterium]